MEGQHREGISRNEKYREYIKYVVPCLLILIIIGGILIRYTYCENTSVYQRQHDVSAFRADDGDDRSDGHYGYIEHIYLFKELPQENIQYTWQYYHPPLHHAICAAYLGVLTSFGVDLTEAEYTLQNLTLVYSSLTLIVVVLLCKRFLNGIALVVAATLAAFHPTFIIMSGSLNNDMLSVLFMSLVLLFTVDFLRSGSLKHLIFLALSFGFGMMTKFSVVQLAIPVGIMFLYKLYVVRKERSLLKRSIINYSIFGIIALPLGLWWSIRSYVRFDIPPTFVPSLGTSYPQFVGTRSIFARIFDFSSHQFQSPFLSLGDNDYYEFNPITGLLKTSLFDEYNGRGASDTMMTVSRLLFYIGALFCLLAVIAFFVWIFKRVDSKQPPYMLQSKIFLALTAVIVFVMFIYFCREYPYTCSMNARYIAPVLMISWLSVGALVQILRSSRNKLVPLLQIPIFMVVLVFCALSIKWVTLL